MRTWMAKIIGFSGYLCCKESPRESFQAVHAFACTWGLAGVEMNSVGGIETITDIGNLTIPVRQNVGIRLIVCDGAILMRVELLEADKNCGSLILWAF